MRISNLKLPKLSKLSNAKAGDLVTVYTSMLVRSGTYIVAAGTGIVSANLDSDTGVASGIPMPPVQPAPWGAERPVTLFNPNDGQMVSASPFMRCDIHNGAAIVLDFVEGA